jgi:hypothetical protein
MVVISWLAGSRCSRRRAVAAAASRRSTSGVGSAVAGAVGGWVGGSLKVGVLPSDLVCRSGSRSRCRSRLNIKRPR